MASLLYGVVINPVEDSTSDNLRALAFLIDRASQSSMKTSLVTRGGAITLRAEGTIDEAASAARASSRSAIYPTIVVHCSLCEAAALSLLDGDHGIDVLVGDEASPAHKETAHSGPREIASAPPPEDLVRVRRHRSGEAAGQAEATRLFRSLGYTGPVEPAGDGPQASEGLFRVVLPHYGLPPMLEDSDGVLWRLTEEGHPGATA